VLSDTIGATHLRFDRDGRIVLQQDFWDSTEGSIGTSPWSDPSSTTLPPASRAMRAERLASLLVAGALTLCAAAAAAEIEAERYRYDVFLDDRPIGTHTFEIDRDSGAKRVRSRAEFQVKVLMVALYRYEHSRRALQDGCLRELASQTDDTVVVSR